MSTTEQNEILNYLQPIINDEHVQEMKKYIQHGSITTYDHCFKVACISYMIAKRLGLKIDYRTLVMGAFLHDFYLYDWHGHKSPDGRMHGFTHAQTACDNACNIFHVTPGCANIISTHMWPLTITRIPRSRAGFIVCLADKYCAAVETISG